MKDHLKHLPGEGEQDSARSSESAAWMPADVFEAPDSVEIPEWTCVRTRPRWEKKFARIMARRGERLFLPVARKEVVSFRHRRVHEILLFPGYVFIARNARKNEFTAERIVVRLLRPSGPADNRILHEQLKQVWLGIRSGTILRPVHGFGKGEPCEITDGPMRGTRGRYERPGRQGRVILAVEMLGMGASIELPIEYVTPIK